MITRRNFTKMSAAGLIGATSIGKFNTAKANSKPSHTPLIGTCNWTLGIDEPEALMKTLKECNLNALQFNGSPGDVPAKDLLASASAHGITLIALDPFDCQPESTEQATKENAFDFYFKAIEYAKELSVPLTIHGLTTWTAQQKTRDAKWQRLIELCNACIGHAKKQEVALIIEPCNLYEIPLIHSAADFDALMAQLDDPEYIGYLPDAFHMNIHEKDSVATLRTHAKRTPIYHISDSNRGGIGRGHIDFQAHHDALAANGFTGPVVVEVVLANNPVNTAPRNAAEMQDLQTQIRESVKQWRQYHNAYYA